MSRTLGHLRHVLFLHSNLAASLSATGRAAIGANMNRNLENLKPVLLLPSGEGKLLATLHAFLMKIHIPHRRTVGVVRCMFRQVGLDRANWHLLETILMIIPS